MDNAVLNYIEKRFGKDSVNPVFIADGDLNIPEKDVELLNKKLTYNLLDYDLNGTDLSHTYIQRSYKGTMHDSNTEIRYMKNLSVKVVTNEEASQMKNSVIFTDRFFVHDSRDNVKTLRRKVSSIIHKFLRGDIAPKNISVMKLFNDSVNIEYTIGSVHICSNHIKDINATEYFIAVLYTSNCEVN